MPQELGLNPRFGLSKKLRVGVLCGGKSSERKISKLSGRAVFSALKRAGAPVLYLDPANPSEMEKRLKKIDIAFIALHGHGGEDGKIQSFLEKRKMPYVGSGPKGSLVAFDKLLSKRAFCRHKIPTAEFVMVNAKNWAKRLKRFKAPFVVKPPCEGSSIGVFLVEDFEKSVEKINQAIREYGELLIERKIDGREFTVGVLGSSALPVIELVPKNPFYDFHAKYTKGMTDYRIPAPISKKLARKMQRIALAVHRCLGMRDMSRVDMMTDSRGRVYVLEANSIPGFTEFSLLPKAAKAIGISFEELCMQLVTWAHARKKKH